MTPALTDDAVQRIREALQRCNKIAAIKVYRESHPVSLAEAKQAVEEMEEALFATHPNWYTRHTRYLRRTRSRRIQIFGLISYSFAAVMSGIQAMSGPRGSDSEPTLWYHSPYFFCFFFTGLALLNAWALWSARRKH
jgi:hypothetical protein